MPSQACEEAVHGILALFPCVYTPLTLSCGRTHCRGISRRTAQNSAGTGSLVQKAQIKAPALVQDSELTFSYLFALDFRIFEDYDSYAFVTKQRQRLARSSNGKAKHRPAMALRGDGKVKQCRARQQQFRETICVGMAKPTTANALCGRDLYREARASRGWEMICCGKASNAKKCNGTARMGTAKVLLWTAGTAGAWYGTDTRRPCLQGEVSKRHCSA